MEIYKRHHETWTIYNRRNLNDLQIAINKKIHELIEIVEWYIELIEVGSNKYIVPHTKPYRNQ